MENQFPYIKTKRLVLNKPVAEDIPNLLQLLNSSEIYSENTLNIPYPYLEEHAHFWLQLAEKGLENQEAYIFAIRNSETLEMMGAIGLHVSPQHQKAEVGYWMGENFQNQGYMTEALESVLYFGFETLHLNKIYATYFTHNPSSGHILKKVGMIEEGILRQEYIKNGHTLDVIRLSLLR